MRHLLISAAVLALTAGAAFAQPGHEHERHGGGAPQAQAHPGPAPRAMPAAPRMAAPMAPRAAPRAAFAHGGPEAFTNRIEGRQPDQGQGRRFGEERGRFAQMAPQQPVAPQAEPNRGGEHGNWQGRGERGHFAQMAPQQQPAAPQAEANRGREHGNWQGRGDWRARQQAMAPAPQEPNRALGRYNDRYNGQRGYANKRNAYGGGQRFASRGGARDFSTFRDFHRDIHAQHRFHIGGYHRPSGWYSHRWTFGEFLPAPFWVQDYWLADYYDYDLPPPPYGTVWVRVNDDALLIDEDTGEIITVVYDVFY